MIFSYEVFYYNSKGEEEREVGFCFGKSTTHAMAFIETYYGGIMWRCNVEAIDGAGVLNLGDDEVSWQIVKEGVKNNATW